VVGEEQRVNWEELELELLELKRRVQNLEDFVRPPTTPPEEEQPTQMGLF
jgi:hypothetical protein